MNPVKAPPQGPGGGPKLRGVQARDRLGHPSERAAKLPTGYPRHFERIGMMP